MNPLATFLDGRLHLRRFLPAKGIWSSGARAHGALPRRPLEVSDKIGGHSQFIQRKQFQIPDYDRDGFIDLFVSNYVDLDLAATPQPRYAPGVAAADFDNDGWPDIYVACDMTPSLLFRNRRDGTFEERGVAAGGAYNFDGRLQAGMGVAVGDYDGDGRLDIAKTNFSGDLTSPFQNDDGKFFTGVSREAGLGARQLLGWGIAFIDALETGRSKRKRPVETGPQDESCPTTSGDRKYPACRPVGSPHQFGE